MDWPPERRYQITTVAADGNRQRLGRYLLRHTDATARAENRTGVAIATLDVVSIERTGSTWTLTAEDGATWSLGGCNCGS